MPPPPGGRYTTCTVNQTGTPKHPHSPSTRVTSHKTQMTQKKIPFHPLDCSICCCAQAPLSPKAIRHALLTQETRGEHFDERSDMPAALPFYPIPITGPFFSCFDVRCGCKKRHIKKEGLLQYRLCWFCTVKKKEKTRIKNNSTTI